MIDKFFRKSLAIGIMILFIASCIIPNISGNAGLKINKNSEKHIPELTNNNPIEQIFNPTDDTMICKANPNDLHGNYEYINIRNTSGAGSDIFEIDGLIKFNISSIPPNATILSSTLNLYYYEWGDNNPAGRNLNLYRIITNWDEESVTWNTQPSYAPQPTTYATVPSSYGWMIWNVRSDVQNFINGTNPNYGWKITDENGWGNANIPNTLFRSKEYGNYIPYLQIEYTNGNIFYPTDDTFINQHVPDGNMGSVAWLRVRGYSGWNIYTLIKFDLSSIPLNTFINSATLNLFYRTEEGEGDPTGHTLQLHRILSDWNEETVTWNTQPSHEQAVISSAIVPDTPYIWMSWNVTNSVQNILNGTYMNYGWKLIDIVDSSDMPYFYSKEYGDYIPYLEIVLAPSDYIYVDDNFNPSTPGWGYDHFNNIQNGINAVAEGGTVYVYDGTYYENVVIDKSLSLIGEDRNNTIIDSSWQGSVITITADNVNISGFTVQHCGFYWTLYDRGAGIDVYANHVQIVGNNIIDNGLYGIWLCNANYVNISENELLNQPDATILFDFSSHININHNHIAFGSWGGICIGNHASYNIISYNIIENTSILQGNGFGIAIANHEGNIFNSIFGNTIANNSAEGIFCDFSSNTFYHNNLINNNPNAKNNANNIWDNESLKQGNYWDDYTGQDNNHDGIGDTPYNIPGGNNKDNYPLMTPYGLPHADFNYTKNGRNIFFNASYSYDYNGNIISYGWDFGDGRTGTGITISHTYTNYGTFNAMLMVTDNNGLTNETSKEITLVNNPPNTPSNPNPSDDATGVSIYTVLSWSCSDPDNDTLTYDVYFGTSSNPPLVSSGQSQPYYDPPGPMNYNTHYYWKIVATDEFGASTTGSIWDFTTGSEPNHPPNTPSDPLPQNGTVNVSLGTSISWACSDPDGDSLTYDVYFEANDSTPHVLVSKGQSETIFNPGILQPETTYYWQIIATDIHGASTVGPVWHFTTKQGLNYPPDAPIIDGPTMGKPGDNFTYTFVSKDPENDKVYYQIIWGDGTIQDWFGPFESNEVVIKTHVLSIKGKFTIMARAKDSFGNIGEWGTLNIVIPRNQITPNILLQRFLLIHSNLFIILQKLLQRVG